MELSDMNLFRDRDWDPEYLIDIFTQDFEEYPNMWESNISDTQLVNHVEKLDKYCLVVEDISIDDETLCSAVEQIEYE